MKTLENLQAAALRNPTSKESWVAIEKNIVVADPVEIVAMNGDYSKWSDFCEIVEKYPCHGESRLKSLDFDGCHFEFLPGISGDGLYGGLMVNTGMLCVICPSGTDLSEFDFRRTAGLNWVNWNNIIASNCEE